MTRAAGERCKHDEITDWCAICSPRERQLERSRTDGYTKADDTFIREHYRIDMTAAEVAAVLTTDALPRNGDSITKHAAVLEGRSYQQRMQRASLEHAVNVGEEWSRWEEDLAEESDLRSRDVAAETKRTYYSAASRRAILRSGR